MLHHFCRWQTDSDILQVESHDHFIYSKVRYKVNKIHPVPY